MILQLAFLLAANTILPLTSVAWSGDGHRLVCEIAGRHPSPEGRRLVHGLRGGESGTFAESWADEVPGEERGGNRVLVSFFGDRGTSVRPIQLHTLWDSGSVRRARLRWPAGVTFVYSVATGGNIAQAYYARALPITKQRIRQAGIRLAHLINEAARGRTSFTF